MKVLEDALRDSTATTKLHQKSEKHSAKKIIRKSDKIIKDDLKIAVRKVEKKAGCNKVSQAVNIVN